MEKINKRCNFIAPEAFIDFIAVPYKCSSFNADALWDPFFNVTFVKDGIPHAYTRFNRFI